MKAKKTRKGYTFHGVPLETIIAVSEVLQYALDNYNFASEDWGRYITAVNAKDFLQFILETDNKTINKEHERSRKPYIYKR